MNHNEPQRHIIGPKRGESLDHPQNTNLMLSSSTEPQASEESSSQGEGARESGHVHTKSSKRHETSKHALLHRHRWHCKTRRRWTRSDVGASDSAAASKWGDPCSLATWHDQLANSTEYVVVLYVQYIASPIAEKAHTASIHPSMVGLRWLRDQLISSGFAALRPHSPLSSFVVHVDVKHSNKHGTSSRLFFFSSFFSSLSRQSPVASEAT